MASATVAMDRATGLAHAVRGWFPIPVYLGYGDVGEEDVLVAECGEYLTVDISTPLPALVTCLWCAK